MGDITNRDFVKDLLKYHTNNKFHICEVLRLIYDEVYKLPETNSKDIMTELLVDASIMAKKMQNRLYYYQKQYSDDTGNKARGIVGLSGVRARAKMRQARKVYDQKSGRTN